MDPQNAPAPPEPEQYNTHTKVGNALTVTQPGERTICEIRRHPIGVLGIYVATGLLLVITAVLAFIVAPHFVHDASGGSGSATKYGALIFLVVAVVSLVFAFVSNKVYWGNSWILTSDSITQISQTSLFHRESSQLSLGNLEDVTAEQNGVLTHMLNYGLLRVETAGERSKFVFLYCPNPNYYAQQVLSARENFEQNRRGEDLQRPYREENSYQQSSQPQSQAAKAGDQGYGAYLGPSSGQAYTSATDYPGDSNDQGVNVND